MPGDESSALKGIERPYVSRYARGKCKHADWIHVDLGYDFVTDMLVMEIQLSENRRDAEAIDPLWLNRAAQSLAEAIRLAASKELDIEFTELVTGYRVRTNALGLFVDIYLYDSLSSGAGYSVRIAQDVGMLLQKAKAVLNCTCQSACQNCLKHYRNYIAHGMLDRFTALDLLNWAHEGKMPTPLTTEQQREHIKPLERILLSAGYRIIQRGDNLAINKEGMEKKLIVYPGMMMKPQRAGHVYVSDIRLKYAKPYALQEIEKDFAEDG